MNLQYRLLTLKLHNRMTTEVLSQKSGVPKGTINKILNGDTRNPTGETVKRLADVMHCPLEILMDEEKFDAYIEAYHIRNRYVSIGRRALGQCAPLQIPGVHLGSDSPHTEPDSAEIIPIAGQKVNLLGEIAAGRPMECVEENGITVPFSGGMRCDFALKVHGDSMIGARILDGDVVFIRQQDDVPDGSIAAVCIDNTATLKRVYHIQNGLRLVSENPKYPTMVFTYPDCDSIRILGLAVGLSGAIH